MKLRMLRKYDRAQAGALATFDRAVGRALCRNADPFGVPADESSMAICERAGEATYRQLQRWATGLGIPATGDAEELREAVLVAAREGS